MSKYRLKCWKAPDDMPTTFCEEEGTLFFSELFFKWKDFVPTHTKMRKGAQVKLGTFLWKQT